MNLIATVGERQGSWNDAALRLEDLAKLHPGDRSFAKRLADAYAEVGEWSKARDLYERFVNEFPNERHYALNLACISLMIDDRQARTADFRRLIERIGNSPNITDRDETVWACVQSPDTVADWTDILKIAERNEKESDKNYAYIQSLGAAQVRAGRYQDAIKTLERSTGPLKQENDEVGGNEYDWLFLALAHARLKHTVDARQWLECAERRIAEKQTETPKPNWITRLQYRLLTQEVRQFIK